MSTHDNMTISELSRVTGIPASTIRFYLREGILPAPERRGKTRAYYGAIHVQRLREIKKLRIKSELSINEIKERLAPSILNDKMRVTDPAMRFDRKGDIISAAIKLFRTRGYDCTSIDDIAERAKISKRSFYLHFAGKKELFIECADRIFFDIDREFAELKNERNLIQRFRMRAKLFIMKRRHFITMLHLVRGTLTSVPLRHRVKLKKIMQNLINPIIDDLDEGVRQGLFANLNTTIIAHMIMGGVEYGIYYLERKNPESTSDDIIEHWVDQIIALTLPGIHIDPGASAPNTEQDPQ
jgi:AcrR family transcriptional regulator